MSTTASLFFAAGAAAAVVLLASVAFGQVATPPAREAPTVLPPVVISATRGERSVEDLPVSATVITRDEIINAPGRSVEEVLRGVASVQLQAGSSDVVFPLLPSIAIRGIGVGDTATRALVLIDGIPVNGGFFGNVFWNRILKENVERIEVVRGASSSLYGSYAMGGVVNIVTRVPTQREGQVEGQVGEHETYQGNVRFGEVLANKALTLGFNANYYETQGYFRLPPQQRTPVEERLGGRLYNLQGRGDMTLSDSVKGFVRLGYNHQDRFGGFEDRQADSAIADFASGIDIDAGGLGLVSLRGFYAYEDFYVDNVNVPDPFTSFVSNRHHTTSHDYGFSTQWSRGFGLLASRVTAGVDFRRIDGEDDQDIFNAPDTPRASHVVGEGTQTSVGVFGEVSLKPIDTVEILGNLRFDVFLDSDGRIVTDGVPRTFSDRTRTFVSPRIAARWQFTRPVALQASYYEGFWAPTLAELYRSFETPTFRGLSNPDLSPQRLRGGDLGLDVRVGRLSGQLNGFYNRVKNFVGSEEVGFTNDKFTVMTANVAEINSRGFELIATLQITDTLSFTTNYTYTDAEVVKGPLKGNRVEGAPENVAGFWLYYNAPFGLSVNPRARYVGKSFQDITNEAVQDAHWIFDVFSA
jgi:outer membrane receptor protein involved in Fe transport